MTFKDFDPSNLAELILSENEIPNRLWLRPGDRVHFLLEYQAGAGWSASDANQYITNLKISPAELRKNPSRQVYKERAVEEAAQVIRQISRKHGHLLFVPVPPSKPIGHAEHDDRLVRILDNANVWRAPTLITCSKERTASHHSTSRRDPGSLAEAWDFQRYDIPEHATLVIFDDVITSGATFRAAHTHLRMTYPKNIVVGLFLACAVNADWDAR